MKFLTTGPIEIASMIAKARASDGAICVFEGVVRNESEGRTTTEIVYEAYEPMAESEMDRIADGLAREWPSARVLMVHRTGRLEVGEASVAVVATSPHRSEAFAACRAAIDRIKTTVPIWKKERYADGTEEWIDPTGRLGDGGTGRQ
jgi:molybdopterin synthase catalytic subunit